MGGKPSVEYKVITRQPTQEEIQQALAPRLEQLELSERKLRVIFFFSEFTSSSYVSNIYYIYTQEQLQNAGMVQQEKLAKAIEDIERKKCDLQQNYILPAHLRGRTDDVLVMIMGPMNAGKSSLVNAVLRRLRNGRFLAVTEGFDINSRAMVANTQCTMTPTFH
jgi:polynucleotide 5'-kinase involved in rRNA processing